MRRKSKKPWVMYKERYDDFDNLVGVKNFLILNPIYGFIFTVWKDGTILIWKKYLPFGNKTQYSYPNTSPKTLESSYIYKGEVTEKQLDGLLSKDEEIQRLFLHMLNKKLNLTLKL